MNQEFSSVYLYVKYKYKLQSSWVPGKIPFEELAAILEIQSLFFKIIYEPNLMKIYELISTFFFNTN